jgi:hypothetical protein
LESNEPNASRGPGTSRGKPRHCHARKGSSTLNETTTRDESEATQAYDAIGAAHEFASLHIVLIAIPPDVYIVYDFTAGVEFDIDRVAVGVAIRPGNADGKGLGQIETRR